MRTDHLLLTLMQMMNPYDKGEPSERKDKLADMLWGNGSMLATRLRGIMLSSEEPNWGDRWKGGILFCGSGENSLRRMRHLQDRLLPSWGHAAAASYVHRPTLP